MSRTNSQAEIVSEEQLVPCANRLVIKKNNQRITLDLHITDTMLRFTLGYDEDHETKMIAILKMVATRLHQPWRAILSVLNRSLTGKDSSWDTVRLPILQILWGIVHSANLDFASLIWDEFEWQTVERSSRPSKISKLFTTNGDYKFGMEVTDAMISDAIKKKAGYTYYMAKKVESEKAKIVDEPEKQHISLVKSGRGKGFMCYGDQVVNVPNKLKKNVIPRKTRSLTIAEEIKGSKASRLKSLRKKKQPVAGEGSSAAHNKYYDTNSDATLYSSSLDKTEEGANETDDADESDMDLSDDNPQGDNDAARYGVFMHNKSTPTPNSTYLSLTVTSSSLDFIQTLLDETPVNELMDFMSHPVYTDAQTTSVVNNLEGNPKLTSYISCASEVPVGTHVDVLATKMLLQEMFPNKNAYHLSSPPATKTSYPTTYP
ncbi:hypothetical protein Tco_0874924 [Tanacetum coccineum]|uniref:Uncharacterized protein n=1 Tax=Tanacetum coccineum TaxID=301880 RepID=A0ABQ5BRN1_9ASTR